MRIKTLTAPSMDQAIRLIREQLGKEALILGTRKVTGADGKQTLEITAAIDEPAPASTPVISLSAPDKPLPAAATAVLPQAQNSLAAHGLPENLIQRLTTATQGLSNAGFGGIDALEMVLGKMLRFISPAEIIRRGAAHVFVGPTGAGKTTLLAKLAIQAKAQNLKVGLMSLDDVKIAGFEPLAIAAEALGEQAHLIRNPADLKTAAAALGPRHILLIDTPGLNPYNRRAITSFHQRLTALNLPHTCHLVTPANLNADDMRKLPVAFSMFQPTSLLITKVDETGSFGAITHTAEASNLTVGIAANSPGFATPPLTLTPRWLAETLSTPPVQPWEMAA